MSSGYVAMEWVHGEGENDWEPVACLEYWEVFAVAEALVPYIKEKKSHASSAELASAAFENALNKMRDRYKGSDGNSTG